MHPVILKTFGGLSKQYYLRQFVFGLIFPGIMYLAFSSSRHPTAVPFMLILMCIVNTLLYPYSRYVYESVMGFIIGNNVFWGNAILMLGFKLMTMALCWGLAIFMAPLGLAYLFFHHSKSRN